MSTTITISGSGSPTFQYEIGQYVASEGGVIAHRWWSTTPFGSPTAGTVQNYLVIDTTILALNNQWASSTVDIPTAVSLWDGATNTANMIAAGPGAGITAGTAAVLCDSSTNNGKNDWYLPAVDEFVKVWINRFEVERGLLTASATPLGVLRYWLSTQSGTTTAYWINGIDGNPSSGANKTFTTPYNTRAMRKFSI